MSRNIVKEKEHCQGKGTLSRNIVKKHCQRKRTLSAVPKRNRKYYTLCLKKHFVEEFLFCENVRPVKEMLTYLQRQTDRQKE